MKEIRYFILLFTLTTLLGCSDWLDVKPIDKNLEETQFSSEENIYSLVNGFYLSMASNELYGGRLTMTDLELLAHYYYAPTDLTNQEGFRFFYNMQNYVYENETIELRFSGLWSKMYSLILQINIFIEHMKSDEVLTAANRDIVLGEAYALRAFLHFDLFRLFGPIPSDGLDVETIPYNDSPLMQIYPNLNGTAFITRVLDDITRAKTLLKDDPILESGVVKFDDVSEMAVTEKFNFCMRNRRMNILATETLEARVLMYLGQKSEAKPLALSTLEKMKDIIVWTPISKVVNGTQVNHITYNSDYIFHTELLFAIENPNLHKNWTAYILDAPNTATYAVHNNHLLRNILDVEADNLLNLTDIRTSQWMINMNLGSGFYVSRKFYSPTFGENKYETMIKYAQPLMRMSELYYIIGESYMDEGLLPEAVRTFNEVLKARNKKADEVLKETATYDELSDFLEREYYREFYAEGQTFFYLKRNAKDMLFPTNGAVGHMYAMDKGKYIVPIPLNEENF